MLIINTDTSNDGKTLSITLFGNIKPERKKDSERAQIVISGKPGEEPTTIEEEVHRNDESEIDKVFQKKNFIGVDKVIIGPVNRRGKFNLNGHADYLVGKIHANIPKGVEVHIRNMEGLSNILGKEFIALGRKPR